VFRYKDKDVPVGTIGRELNVPAVITGNLMRHENAFVLHVELVDCASETVIWHGDYDRPNSAFATVAGEIARDVANRLRTRLSGPDERRIAQNYTENSAAYELYLKGRFYWDKRDPESFATAENAYKQAITLDPNYALAYAGLADLYLFRGTDNERQKTMPQARAFALKALALDESLAEAHTTLAFVNENFDFDMRAAERGFKRAIELKPNYAIAHQFFGGFLVQTGHVDEGLAEVRRAVELEPYSAAINWHLGLMLMFAGHYDEAIEQQQKTLLIQPNYDLSEITLAAANIYAGRLNEASAIIQKRLQTDNTNENWLTIARIEILSGNRGKGIDILDRVLKEQAGDKTNNYSIAGVYATLGESDKAIDWLNRGYEQRAFSMFFLRVDPLFDSLHNDQRYQDLLRRLNLSE
jgi:Tfp pilus assembly protein PilF